MYGSQPSEQTDGGIQCGLAGRGERLLLVKTPGSCITGIARSDKLVVYKSCVASYVYIVALMVDELVMSYIC